MIFKAASELQTKACNANKFDSVPSNIFLSIFLNMNACCFLFFLKKDSFLTFNESGHLSFSWCWKSSCLLQWSSLHHCTGCLCFKGHIIKYLSIKHWVSQDICVLPPRPGLVTLCSPDQNQTKWSFQFLENEVCWHCNSFKSGHVDNTFKCLLLIFNYLFACFCYYCLLNTIYRFLNVLFPYFFAPVQQLELH